MDNITRADLSLTWTVREVGRHVALGGIGPVVCGTAQTIADAIEAWVDELVPELQRRGRYKTVYEPGTLRHKMFGRGPHLHAPHSGAGLNAPSRTAT